MSNIKKILLLCLVSLIIGVVWLYKLYSKVEIMPTNERTEILTLANGKKIYLRAKIWGVSGNHEEVIFSESPISVADKEVHYIFYTNEVLYRTDDNILTIYAPQSGKSIPKRQFKDVEVVFKGLKTANEIKDYSINFQKYGLQRISVYEQ